MTSLVTINAHCADDIQVRAHVITTDKEGVETRRPLAPITNGQTLNVSIWNTQRVEVREEPIPVDEVVWPDDNDVDRK